MIDASSALALASQFEAVAGALPVKAQTTVIHYGARLHSAVVSRAPGTSYPGTIRIEPVTRGSFAGVGVGTDRRDGFRREMGFHGRDSRGRTYSQSGQAHFSTGFDAVAGDFEQAMIRLALQD